MRTVLRPLRLVLLLTSIWFIAGERPAVAALSSCSTYDNCSDLYNATWEYCVYVWGGYGVCNGYCVNDTCCPWSCSSGDCEDGTCQREPAAWGSFECCSCTTLDC